MKSLDVARTLEAGFGNRSLARHCFRRGVKRFEHGAHNAFVVLDLTISRQILISRSFAAFNYFEEGIQRLQSSGTAMPYIKRFFDQGLLFREGPDHHSAKHASIKLLDQETAHLEALSPRVAAFMRKRRAAIKDPLHFSRVFVRLCIGLVIARVTQVSLLSAMRVLRARENIFYFHFHPIRHRRTNNTLARLEEMVPASDDMGRYGSSRILIESLITMGYDPLIGSLCAGLVERNRKPLDGAPGRCCPVSFVSRICVEKTCIAGHEFETGDVCYIALVPAVDEQSPGATFPFGLGAHTCIGKRFSKTVLQLAQDIVQQEFSNGFERTPQIDADGAFLAFKHN